MRICHILQSTDGGAPRIADLLISAQVKAGHKVTVISVMTPNPTWKLFAQADQISTVKLENLRPRFTRVLPTHEVWGAMRLAKLIQSHTPDIIISHYLLPTQMLYLASRLLGFKSPPVITYVHASLRADLQQMTQHKLPIVQGLFKWLGLRSLQQSSGIVFVCRSLQDEAKQLGFRHPHALVSYNPVVPGSTGQPLHPEAVAWFNDPNLIPFVSAARFSPQKDHDTLLRAFAQVHRRYPQARLMLLGNGESMSQYQSMAQSLGVAEAILFAGYVPNPQDYFSPARAVILSSHWEGLPLVLVEAIASGTPFITSDCPGGCRELTELLGSGTLVKPADVAALTNALTRHIEMSIIPEVSPAVMEQFQPRHCTQALDRFICTLFPAQA